MSWYGRHRRRGSWPSAIPASTRRRRCSIWVRVSPCVCVRRTPTRWRWPLTIWPTIAANMPARFWSDLWRETTPSCTAWLAWTCARQITAPWKTWRSCMFRAATRTNSSGATSTCRTRTTKIAWSTRSSRSHARSSSPCMKITAWTSLMLPSVPQWRSRMRSAASSRSWARSASSITRLSRAMNSRCWCS